MAQDDRETTSMVKTILELKDQEPYVPFRIVMTSGKEYIIDRGENLMELKSEFFYAPGRKGFVLMRKSQIASVERGTSRKNGRKSA